MDKASISIFSLLLWLSVACMYPNPAYGNSKPDPGGPPTTTATMADPSAAEPNDDWQKYVDAGKKSLSAQDYVEAEQWFKKAMNELVMPVQRQSRVFAQREYSTFCNLYQVQDKLGKNDKAILTAQKWMACARKFGTHSGEYAAAHTAEVISLVKHGDYALAGRPCEEAVAEVSAYISAHPQDKNAINLLNALKAVLPSIAARCSGTEELGVNLPVGRDPEDDFARLKALVCERAQTRNYSDFGFTGDLKAIKVAAKTVMFMQDYFVEVGHNSALQRVWTLSATYVINPDGTCRRQSVDVSPSLTALPARRPLRSRF